MNSTVVCEACLNPLYINGAAFQPTDPSELAQYICSCGEFSAWVIQPPAELDIESFVFIKEFKDDGALTDHIDGTLKSSLKIWWNGFGSIVFCVAAILLLWNPSFITSTAIAATITALCGLELFRIVLDRGPSRRIREVSEGATDVRARMLSENRRAFVAAVVSSIAFSAISWLAVTGRIGQVVSGVILMVVGCITYVGVSSQNLTRRKYRSWPTSIFEAYVKLDDMAAKYARSSQKYQFRVASSRSRGIEYPQESDVRQALFRISERFRQLCVELDHRMEELTRFGSETVSQRLAMPSDVLREDEELDEFLEEVRNLENTVAHYESVDLDMRDGE